MYTKFLFLIAVVMFAAGPFAARLGWIGRLR